MSKSSWGSSEQRLSREIHVPVPPTLPPPHARKQLRTKWMWKRYVKLENPHREFGSFPCLTVKNYYGSWWDSLNLSTLVSNLQVTPKRFPKTMLAVNVTVEVTYSLLGRDLDNTDWGWSRLQGSHSGPLPPTHCPTVRECVIHTDVSPASRSSHSGQMPKCLTHC